MNNDVFARFLDKDLSAVQPLTPAGSNRQYYRLTHSDGTTSIGVIGTSREENHAFITLAHHFAERGLNVPRVISVSDDEMVYVQTDLGNLSLFDALLGGRKKGGKYGERERELLRRTIALLPRFQIKGAEGLDFSVCYPHPEFDERSVMFDLNYFKYCFLKATGIDFNESRLEDDLHLFAEDIIQHSGPCAFMYRDFQARNVMLCDTVEKDCHFLASNPLPTSDVWPVFIDFQGGRRGPVLYDVVSFLWQASAHYPQSLRDELVEIYLSALAEYMPAVSADALKPLVPRLVLFRTLQVLGTYGFRGYFERKPHFLASIPSAIDNLRSSLPVALPYPCLHDVLEALCHTFADTRQSEDQPSGQPVLHVRVFSFSYKRGIPEDTTGNGGGYVFDCRSTNNPGRYEQYKNLTGLDRPVIDFLEKDGEIMAFLQSVYSLADTHVERYIERRFNDLMFAFGCTGGQHRSVYCAEHLALHLRDKYGVRVTICHRERGITREL